MRNKDWEPGETPAELVKRVSIPITNLGLLSRALTHSSYVNEQNESLMDNERLEFLGDAVLDFVVGAWLYNHFPEKKEGELTRMRSSIVRTEKLAEFARKIKLGDSIKLGRGESIAGGRDRDIILCSTFEALIGALLLDTDIITVQSFVEGFLVASENEFNDVDSKSRLQEWTQSRKFGIPTYETVAISGPEHKRIFEVHVHINGQLFGKGIGHNKQSASKEAAIKALNRINKGIG
ncbi:ribonuclease III [Chloroflexota bacterium]